MLRSVGPDLLYICAELMTGKSIPVLVGITCLPVGQVLAWVMVSMGAVSGTLFSVWAAHHAAGMTLASLLNRVLQLCFSLWLSVSLILSVARGIHAERGVALTIIPVCAAVMQPLPQRHSTALVSFILSCLVLYVCTLTSVVDEGIDAHHPVMRHASLAERPTLVLPPPIELSVGEVVSRALQLFLLAFYACVQHAPTQVYFNTSKASSRINKPAYASNHHADHVGYCLIIGMLAAWLRLCVWSAICFFPDNRLHAMLENDHSVGARGAWSWQCCIVYMTALLYSACWTTTQLLEQVLPRFSIDASADRLKCVVCVLVLATLFRQRDPLIMFVATYTLLGVCILASMLGVRQ